tara:strand:+ start:394 stop:585 length:192 start_codon:yes stop_codon:yes gene_type:complete
MYPPAEIQSLFYWLFCFHSINILGFSAQAKAMSMDAFLDAAISGDHRNNNDIKLHSFRHLKER